MKKVLAFLFAVLLMMNACTAFADDDAFTVKTYTDYNTLFDVDVDSEKDICFVECRSQCVV